MRIGYSYWGFLGDYKEDHFGDTLSTPDGNASYSWSIIHEAHQRGHEVYLMQQDRDWPAYAKHGTDNFASFSQAKRIDAYLRAHKTQGSMYKSQHEEREPRFIFPRLNVLVLEWRFPIPGRNTPEMRGKPNYQPDLERQTEILWYYSRLGVPIIILDLDHKLTEQDEKFLSEIGSKVVVFETSVEPLRRLLPRVRVEIPFVIQDLLQHTLQAVDPNRKLVYVGSRYERDDVIDTWIKPLSVLWPQKIEFYGNWTTEYNFAEVQAKWPNVKFMDRITMKDFGKVYGTAVACPLIAKSSYLDTGFITARIWEALLFGTLPLGLSTHTGIRQYLPDELVADDPHDLATIVSNLSRMSLEARTVLHREVVEQIGFMDVSHFLDRIEETTKH